jgi:hypothetical protein
MGLLRTLFIIIAVYYVIKFIGRLAFPHILNRFMQKMENKMREQQGYTKHDETKVGETIIDKAPKSKKSNDSVGEYVDYEEVD